MLSQQLLVPYLTPQQTVLLQYGEQLPPPMLEALCERLHVEVAALRTLVADPVAQGRLHNEGRDGGYCRGSLLCADLSGFTALTEQLATQGRQGVEELSAIINALFGALLDEIEKYGGVVLKFSGDALTIFFDADQLGDAHQALACAAAFALQRRIESFATLKTGSEQRRLRLRVGVHSGRIFLASLGDDHRRELLVAGKDVNRATQVQERSSPGEVLASAETVAGLPQIDKVARHDGLFLLLEPPPVQRPAALQSPPDYGTSADMETALRLAECIAALRLYLPKALPQRFIDTSDSGTPGEFRPVTVVFINFFSFSHLLERSGGEERRAVGAINTYYTRVQQIIDAYGGHVNKLDVASFGERLIAVFGAPLAQEDDPQRAVQAALELHTALDEVNREIEMLFGASESGPLPPLLSQRIGIATGTVYAGLVGGPQRREYTVIGHTVNLAARLMADGEPGQVLLGPSTWRAVDSHFQLEHLPSRTLKGIPGPIPAALALQSIDRAALAASSQLGQFVGRAEELQTLHELLQQTMNGTGGVVALSGDAGIGKTRLAQELLRNTPSQSLRCVAVSSRSLAATTPYSLARDLLLQAFELPSSDTASDLRGALEQIVVRYVPDMAFLTPLLYSFVGVESDSGVVQPATGVLTLPPAEQRERLHDLLQTLFDGLAAEQPLILLLDDLQWADASSLEIVQRLTQGATTRRLLLLLLYRPDPEVAEPWLSLPHTTKLLLGPIDGESSIALLDMLLGGEAPAAMLPLLDRAQGSPFFLEALIHHLVDTGELQRGANNQWALRRSLDSISMPIDIERLLIARLDRLEEQTRSLVHIAAVIGSRVTYPVLAGIYSQAKNLAQRLAYLVHTGILEIDEQDEQEPFRFRHTLLREVAYQSILYTTRRHLHRLVAERMEFLSQSEHTDYVAELAHHFLLAEEWQPACRYSLQMGHRAYARYATTEALASYRQAYQIASEHPDEVDSADLRAALEGLADVEVIAGRYDEAHSHYRALLECGMGETAFDTPSVIEAKILRKIGSVYERQGQFDDALEWMQRARTLLATAKDEVPLEIARVCNDIGWVYFRRGDLDGAEMWLRQALDQLPHAEGDANGFAREVHQEALAERARVQNRLGGVAWSRGDLAAAGHYVQQSLEVSIMLGDLLAQADAQNNLGVLADQSGDWAEAIARYQEARKVDQRIGRRREAALSLLNLGIVYYHHGDLNAAIALLEQAVAQTALVDDTLHEAMALRWQGRALTGRGRRREAREALQRAFVLADSQGLLLECLDAYAALGELALDESRYEDVTTALEAGRTLLSEVEYQSPETGYFLRFAAQAAYQRGDDAQAKELLDEATAIFTALDMRGEVVFTEMLARATA